MDDIEVAYHCAAKLGLGRKDDFFSTNVIGTENLLQETVRSNVSRFVYVSSAAAMII
jgi:nucleoside-diphosphate-sugar epimerase